MPKKPIPPKPDYKAPRNAKGHFLKGYTGNPGGRAPLSKWNWMTRHIDEKKQIALLNRAYDMAMDGKQNVIEVLLTRLLPPVPTDDTVDINLKNKSPSERSDEIFNALSEGKITPSQAHMLFSTVCDNLKIIEVTEILDRINKLENSQKVQNV